MSRSGPDSKVNIGLRVPFGHSMRSSPAAAPVGTMLVISLLKQALQALSLLVGLQVTQLKGSERYRA
jgi:hypothetical protein